MKKWCLPLFLCALFAITIVGCKSTPEEPEEVETVVPPVVEPVPQPQPEPVPEPEPVVEPEPEPEPEPVIVLPTAEESAAMFARVDAARKKASDAGAPALFPDEWNYVEAAYAECKAGIDTGMDAETFDEKGKDCVRLYMVLENIALAQKDYDRIVALRFDGDDPSALNNAIAQTHDLRNLVEGGASSQELLDKSSEVQTSFRALLDGSFKTRADTKRAEYMPLENEAKGIFADVADKKGFAQAHQQCVDADAAYARRSYELALENYTKAFTNMTKVYNSVLRRREEAQRAMDQARERARAAALLAEEADTLAPLPADAEGFTVIPEEELDEEIEAAAH